MLDGVEAATVGALGALSVVTAVADDEA